MAAHLEKILILFISIAFKIENLQGIKLPVYITYLGMYSCGHLNKTVYMAEKYINYATYDIYKENVEECLEECCSSGICNTASFSDYSCLGMNIPKFFYSVPLTIPHLNSPNGKNKLKLFRRSIARRDIIPSPKKTGAPCQYGSHSCPVNEYCQIVTPQIEGFCTCSSGTSRNSNGDCVPASSETDENFIPNPMLLRSNEFLTERPVLANSNIQSESVTQSSTVSAFRSASAPRELIVNVSNKTIELKTGYDIYEDWATLSAYALGDNISSYTYKWTLLNKPVNDVKGSVKDTNSQTVSLRYLVIGVYQFKVEVTGPNATGEAVGNITIVPAKHQNEEPIAKILPTNMTVKLPNSAVILDGSESSDDDEIKSFHWEIVIGPIGYKLAIDNGKILELNDLISGNYTIMLEVEDKEGMKGKATATLSVIKETDYPPTANAGGDKNVYLPVDNVILNGTLSSDDHGIKEWEWTKGPEDSGNAVDMRFTREPILQLSKLEEGHYHFILKVADTSGQTATSAVHVYVHSSLDSIPMANAGKNVTLTIPNTSTVLDGSGSTGVSPVTHYLWTQLSGPKIDLPNHNSSAKINVTELSKGESVFQLTLWNNNDSVKNSTSNVTITVVQEKNAAPVANAGQDFKVTLPTSAVIVNGSQSKDDVKISKWLWRRDETSLAAGNVIETSYKSPVLVVTNVVPGRYMWNLTVWDDQGASSSDTVSIIVENPTYHMDQVEVIVGVGIESLSESQKNNLIQKLQLLSSSAESNNADLHVEDIRGMPLSGKTSIIIIGRRDKVVVSGVDLVRKLRAKTLTSHTRLLDLPIISIDTLVCQNNCSGHGECIQASRHCRCNSWWTESSFRKHFGDGIPNCDWSVIYVFVGAIGSALVLGITIWLMAVYGWKKCFKVKRKRNTRYFPLDNRDEGRPATHRSLIDSDSESGSEVLFDARKPKSKVDKRTNGSVKLQRLRN